MMSLRLHVRAGAQLSCTDCIVSVLTPQMNALPRQTSHSQGGPLTGGGDSSVTPKLSPTPSQKSQLSCRPAVCSKCFGCIISEAALDALCWQRFHSTALQMAENWRPWPTLNRRRFRWSCTDAHPFCWRSDDCHESSFGK